MTPRDRFLNCVRGLPVDRVPLFLEGLMYATREELNQEPDRGRREVAERLFDRMHYLHRAGGFGNRWLMTPGNRIRIVSEEETREGIRTTRAVDTPKGVLTACTGRNPTSHTAWTIKYPVESLADIEKIRSVPWELPATLGPPDPGKVPPGFAERGVLRAGISSPMVCVAGMMPYDYFLELCVTEFELIRELTQVCLDRILSVLDVVLSNRAIEYVWLGGSEWLTPPMGSPRLYEELVQRFEAPLIRRIHEAGALVHVHCHGNVRTVLEQTVQRGADFCEPVEPPPDGDITFAEAKALVAERMSLGGNIEARILEKGTEAEVEQAVRAAFEGGTDRMVLRATAGPISTYDTQIVRNYHRMIDVWEELSPVGAKAEPALAGAVA
jgi:hypothetical protein